MKKYIVAALAACSVFPAVAAPEESNKPREVSGIYPNLAMFNKLGECGTGAVVPWADRLWAITYAPHEPWGSGDKLYEITPDLKQIIRPESVGGTPADRMIHKETNQLLIGAYVIDGERNVRVVEKMPGRLTGVARHLTDPATHVYYATMEEALYSVDLRSLKVTELIRDGNLEKKKADGDGEGVDSSLPGYHGKGLYSGQGRVVYANNGDRAAAANWNPATPSGALAEWSKPGQDWALVRRNQFTEVTGPGGIYGNPNPATDPIWSTGWDHRSLILMCLDGGKWYSYRLPKGSHSYDGAHGWNTEWPRIRDVGGDSLLMTMHGTFWDFPKTFTSKSSAGIAPRSNYLKVIADFALWKDQIVFACDDTAKAEFLNKREAKGGIAGPGQSQSNLWFTEPQLLDNLGPAIGRGAVWVDEDVAAGTVSEPYLFSGYDFRNLMLSHEGKSPLTVALELDRSGDGKWTSYKTIVVPAGEAVWTEFPADDKAAWIRLTPKDSASKITAQFDYHNKDRRKPEAAAIFDAVASPSEASTGGLLYARGNDERTLRFGAQLPDGTVTVYDLDGDLNLTKVEDSAAAAKELAEKVPVPDGVLAYDDASIIFEDKKGRWRLPRGAKALDESGPLGSERICREVCTERDLFNAGGTFYELPAENAGGTAKIRPVSTHNRRIKDYASYRGLLVLSGLKEGAPAGEHVVVSEDGRTALWVGVVDDLWKFGKPRGLGGPWKKTAVKAGAASDPYLVSGYDQKTLTLSHEAKEPVNVTIEIDAAGNGQWETYKTIEVQAGKEEVFEFPEAFSAYWLRLKADRDCMATGQLVYR